MNTDDIDESEATCTIGFNLDDNRRDLMELNRQAHRIMTDERLRAWTLDLTACEYLGPDAAAVVLSMVLLAKHHQQDWGVRLPTQPPSLDAFCEFSGLKHWILSTPPPDQAHRDNVTVPLRKITRANFRDADPIIGLVERHSGIAAESAEYMRTCVNEIIQNIEDHAHSPIGGVCCARYLVNKRQVRVAIVDRGIGIASSLRTRYPDILDAQTALRRVVAGGYSTRARPNNAGLGMSHLWNSVKTLGGRVFIMSEDGVAEHNPGGKDIYRSLEPMFPGTGVFFTLPVETDD